MLGWTIHEKITLVKNEWLRPWAKSTAITRLWESELSIGKWVASMPAKYSEFKYFFFFFFCKLGCS